MVCHLIEALSVEAEDTKTFGHILSEYASRASNSAQNLENIQIYAHIQHAAVPLLFPKIKIFSRQSGFNYKTRMCVLFHNWGKCCIAPRFTSATLGCGKSIYTPVEVH